VVPAVTLRGFRKSEQQPRAGEGVRIFQDRAGRLAADVAEKKKRDD